MPRQCRPSEGRLPFDDVPTIQISPGKLALITSGQTISLQRCQPTNPPCIVQAGLAGWLAGWLAGSGWLALVGWLALAGPGWLAGWLAGWAGLGWLIHCDIHIH